MGPVSVLHNGSVIGRRGFLALCSATSGLGIKGRAITGTPEGLHLEYEVSVPPPLPPPLALDRPARAVIELSGAGASAICVLSLRVVLADERFLLPLGVWTGAGHSFWRAREGFGLPAFRGTVAREGDAWEVSTANRVLYAARKVPSQGESASRRMTEPWLVVRFPLAADWTRGPLDEGPVQLQSLRFEPAPQARPLEAAEVSAHGDLDRWFPRLRLAGPVAAASVGDRGSPAKRFERDLDRVAAEPFAFRAYKGGSFGLPEDTSFASDREIDAFRNRKEVRLSGLVIVSVDCVASADLIERVLPPPCEPSTSPMLRVTAIRGLEDPRLDEAWLLAECSLEGARAWYAISHLRSSVDGSAYGREVFGYPTQEGSVGVQLGGNRFAVHVGRKGRGLFQAWGSYGGFSTGTTLDRMTVAALRLGPGSDTDSRAGQVIVQPWYFQGLRRPVVSGSLDAMFPAGKSGSGRDTWNTVGPVHAYWAKAMDGAGMQRRPGRVVAEVADVGPYYRDRCGGRLPWEAAASGGGCGDQS